MPRNRPPHMRDHFTHKSDRQYYRPEPKKHIVYVEKKEQPLPVSHSQSQLQNGAKEQLSESEYEDEAGLCCGESS